MTSRFTQILRFVHISNLETIIRRGGFHSPDSMPNDGLPYRDVHGVSEQAARANISIPCGDGGTIHDYVPFYFGPLSPMMFRLKTGRVAGYSEGQEPLVYCLSAVETICAAGLKFVFSDGHGLARYTRWFDDLSHLSEVDWITVNARYWSGSADDMDRQRRKQAEFLVWKFCPWSVVQEIHVINDNIKAEVTRVLKNLNEIDRKIVRVTPNWY